jgi:hypothetical protein
MFDVCKRETKREKRNKKRRRTMRKMIAVGMILAVAFVMNASAEVYVYSATISANSTNLSDALPVSGIINKIEVSGFSSTVTGTVTVATYDGTTAVDTIVNTGATSANKIVRLMVKPTDTTGTDLAAALSTSVTNMASILTIPYQPVMAGGNLKVRAVNDVGNSIPLKVVFYYERQTK